MLADHAISAFLYTDEIVIVLVSHMGLSPRNDEGIAPFA